MNVPAPITLIWTLNFSITMTIGLIEFKLRFIFHKGFQKKFNIIVMEADLYFMGILYPGTKYGCIHKILSCFKLYTELIQISF